MRFFSGMVVLCSLFPASAQACPYCFSLQGNPFALPHPKTVEIALATRKAIETGHLKADALISANSVLQQGSGLISLDKVAALSMITSWAQRDSLKMNPGLTLTVHFLFIDSYETCGLDVRAGQALVQSKVSVQSDSRIVTTKTVFHALVTGRLTLVQAEKQGLLLVEGDDHARALFNHDDLPSVGDAPRAKETTK